MERIEIDVLRNWLDEPDVFIMDVRGPNDWEATSSKIRNAQWFDVSKFGEWANDLPRDKRLVLY